MKPLKIATWNVCLGMFHKINQIKHQITRENLDLLFINEAELTEIHDLDLLKIKGFDLVIPPNKKQSRISAYVKSNLVYSVNPTNEANETLSITIGSLKILGLYREFKLKNHANFTSQIQSLIMEIGHHNIIIGDVNLDSLKVGISTYRFSHLYELWRSKLDNDNFIQINSKPTWSRVVNLRLQESCLDHIYIKTDIYAYNTFQVTTTSDHDLVGIELGSFVQELKKPCEVYVRKWSNYNHYNINNELSKINWEHYSELDPQGMCDLFDLKLTSIIETITPTIKVKTKTCQNVWNRKLDKLTMTKRTLKRRLRRNPTQNLRDRLDQVNNSIKSTIETDVKTKIRNTIIPGNQQSL